MYDKTPIIKSIQDFVMLCPYVKGMPEEEGKPELAVECSIEPIYAESVFRRYTDGTLLRQYVFTLTSKEAYDAQGREHITASGFSQDFEEWLEEQNDNDIFPHLDGYTPIRTESVSSGFLILSETGFARYQIQCRLIYK